MTLIYWVSSMKKLTIITIILDVLVAICFFVTYSITSFKNTIIASAMSTKTHQYIAYTFYSDEDINQVLAADTYIPFDENTDLHDIVIDTAEKDSYDNEYDEVILTRDDNNEDYKLINVKVGKYDGYLVAVYDPSKVQLMHSKVFNQNNRGKEQVVSMCKRYGALVGINGGGFVDYGTGSDIPVGYIIKNGKIIWSDNNNKGNIIGFSYDNKLMLVNATGDEAIEMGMRDGLEFGPFLIVNGKSLSYANEGVGGYSRSARTAIAQRKDGIVLFFVTKGYVHGLSGPTMGEVIEVLKKYGAYNAANLDGGTSSTLVINNKVINNPINVNGESANGGMGRYVVTSFGLVP